MTIRYAGPTPDEGALCGSYYAGWACTLLVDGHGPMHEARGFVRDEGPHIGLEPIYGEWPVTKKYPVVPEGDQQREPPW